MHKIVSKTCRSEVLRRRGRDGLARIISARDGERIGFEFFDFGGRKSNFLKPDNPFRRKRDLRFVQKLRHFDSGVRAGSTHGVILLIEKWRAC